MITYYATYEDVLWHLGPVLAGRNKVKRIIIEKQPNGWYRIEEDHGHDEILPE